MRWSSCCDAWGHIANDVATGSRTEIGEMTEGSGSLVNDAAQGEPRAVHPDSARRSDRACARRDTAHRVGGRGGRAVRRRLARRMGHPAHPDAAHRRGGRRDDGTDRRPRGRRRAGTGNLSAADHVLAEQQTMAGLAGRPPRSDYLGAIDHLVDAVLQRARHHLKAERHPLHA